MTVVEEILAGEAVEGVRGAILHNAAVEERLRVVACVSNPCGWRRRFELARAFFRRMEAEEAVELYVVELAYGQDDFHVTEPYHPRHLRLRSTGAPLWHKENLINVAVRELLPATWRAVAWIDADVAFDSPSWAVDALRLLNGHFDVLQLFSHAEDLGPDGRPMKVFTGFGRELVRGDGAAPGRRGDRWHPGFAWACTRRAFDRCGGLYDQGILGSGDHYMSMAWLGLGDAALQPNMTDDYHASFRAWQRRARGLRVGYVPGVLRHFYHGQKAARRYHDRFLSLARHRFAPSLHLVRREDGLVEPSAACPPELLAEIAEYFRGRNEDDIYEQRR